MKLENSILKESLIYCPITGVFKWNKDRPLNHFKHLMAKKVYTTRFAGKIAGYSCKGLNTSYVQIRLFNKLYLAHRLSWFYYYGKWPEYEVDHIDGDGSNNAIWNLRDVCKQINGKNSKRKKNNTSGVNAVYWNKPTLKWIAEGHYTEDGVNKKKYLGSFKDIEDAKSARVEWQNRQGGFTERHGNE